jgi:hypothetical protein
MNWQVIKNRTLLWLRKIVLFGLYFAVVAIVFSFLFLQIPAVQKKLIDRYLGTFFKVTGYDITTKSVHLVWYDRLTIEGLKAIDPELNTLLDSKTLKINFSFFSLLKDKKVNIDGIELDSAKIYLAKITDSDSTRDLNISILIDRINKMAASGNKGSSSSKVNIGEIVLSNAKFTYNNSDRDTIAPGFDYNHFSLSIPELQAQNFKVIGDTIQFDMTEMEAIDEQSKFHVHELTTFFRISQNSMEFLNANLKAGESTLSDTIIFKYKSMLDLNDFNRKVNIDLRLKNSILYPKDLALFIPQAEILKYPLQLSGNITGRVNRLIYKNMDVNFGSTSLAGRLEMDGLPVINETFIDLNLRKGKVNINDIAFMFPKNIFPQLQPLGHFNLQGNFTGFTNDFVANGKFHNQLGEIVSDINLKISDEDLDKSIYEGNLQMINFNLGAFLKDTTNFQFVTMKGRINGKGLTEKTADFRLNGVVNSVGLRNYEYKNIVTNARFASSLFNGEVTIDDPNLRGHVLGSIDFRKGRDEVKLQAKIDTANLQQLGILKDRLSFRVSATINSRGLQLDSISGSADLNNISINYKSDSLEIDSIRVVSTLEQGTRLLQLKSSLLDVNLGGDYSYTSLFSDLQNIFHEFYINIANNKTEIANYYSQKRKKIESYQAQFDIILYDVNPLLHLVNLDGSISKNTKIEGTFSNGLTSIFKAYSKIDTAQIMSHSFFGSEIEFTGSKIRDSTTSLASLIINSNQQLIGKNVKTKNLLFEGLWNRDHIDLQLDLDQQNIDNQLRLKSEIDFLEDSTKIKILPSRIHVLNEDWLVSNSNYALVKGSEWSIHQLQLHNKNESVKLDGLISKDPNKILNLEVSNLNLNVFNTISTEKFGGVLNGTIAMRDLYRDAYLQNNIVIKEFTINEFLIGNLTGVNQWNASEKKFNISFFIDRLGTRTANINGFFDPYADEDPLLLNAEFDHVNLKIIEPLLKGIFSNMDGTLTGNYKVTGTFTKPKVTGEGKVEEGQIMINYLKTLYTFTGTLGMTPTQIIFKNFDLLDKFKNKGSLEGYVAHRNFGAFRINLDGTFKNFQLLNTTEKDNDLFYGEGFGTGNLNIFGPSDNLKISATASTGKNTRLYIPISGSSSVDKKDFVKFVNFTDTLVAQRSIKNKSIKKSEPTGITLDLNVDITPDAYAEIIFDVKAGDIIRGRGNGDLKLQLDTKGEFNMFGVVEFTEGAYNFTLYDIINKEFNVRPGGRISWYGDPYQGIMNITASYRQLASFIPIIPNNDSKEVASSPGLKRKYPAEVLLKLDGPMLSPLINFDIEAKDLPTNVAVGNSFENLYLDFNSFKAKLDEQELKRQVFSLIVLRRFSPPNDFNTSGSVYNSVSEFLSNQLSYWLTQVDQNLEIDLDLGTLDREAFNTFQLRVSYSLLGGRLRITKDGSGSFSNQYTQSSASTLVGDWTVDYLLTPDGKFKVKMYSRSNYNTVNTSLGTQNPITTGVSLMYTQNFNELKDLLRTARERRRRELGKEDEPEEKVSNEEGKN